MANAMILLCVIVVMTLLLIFLYKKKIYWVTFFATITLVWCHFGDGAQFGYNEFTVYSWMAHLIVTDAAVHFLVPLYEVGKVACGFNN